MHFVRGQVVRRTDRDFPGWVEVQVRLADGTTAVLVDKEPVFFREQTLTADTTFPVDVEIPCDVRERSADRTALIELHSHIEDEHGNGVFRVAADDVLGAAS
ncbi:hypothetical protein [Paractinoplanes durhamensis]|uniref:Uncharacterized protein n=1 Tax=Paractinoplanes durhamensis TaxID=113563 RepID=A0ABQ3YQG0_9ACTN|nr:hypothetical protein [Actinoplanes durhamensis]GID99804.1 hypothetical protein Adu01nite_11550 [Actinoplanes durhamensis]